MNRRPAFSSLTRFPDSRKGWKVSISPGVCETVRLVAAEAEVVAIRSVEPFHTEVQRFLGVGGNQRPLCAVLSGMEPLSSLGLEPNTQFLQNAWIVTDRWGFIVTGHDFEHREGGMDQYGDLLFHRPVSETGLRTCLCGYWQM